MALPEELASLPEPEIIETLDYEERLADFVAKLVAEMSAVGITYNVQLLETDPAKILLEVATYADTMLRARINDAVRANLLAYANGADLDHLAQFYDVTRLSGETDDALRSRVVLAIRGRSTGGTVPRYAYVARTADVTVKDVAIYTEGRNPKINVAVFSTDAGGVAGQALLDKVSAALNDPAVRMVNDVIEVASAVQTTVNVAADVWMLPTTPISVFNALEAKLRAEWARVAVLGFDVTQAWLISRLMQAGVQKVQIVTPNADVVIPFNRAAALGTVTLTNRGVGF